MRYSVLTALIVVLFWAALPLLTVQAAPIQGADGEAPSLQAETDREGSDGEAPSLQAGADREGADGKAPSLQREERFDTDYRLPVLREGEVVRMDLHSYLTGVILAEMPVSFSEEALKAQAVASRTYALSRCEHRRHREAAVCTASGCCQGWVDPETVDPAARERAEAAVRATDGLAIYYDGALIDATFFSCSGGQTEDAAAVWGSALPYLRSVESPGEEGAAHFSDELRVPLREFRAALEELEPGLSLPEEPGTWIGTVTETPGGGVAEIQLGDRLFSGRDLRKRFGLRSTAFTLALTAEEAVFTTRGNGHRVGMSQYGAQAMAEAGNDFITILQWYYTGVEIRSAG